MKVRKNAEQKNVTIAADYYTERQIEAMLLSKEIGFINEKFEVSNSYEEWKNNYASGNPINRRLPLRVWLDDIEEIKVVYDKEFECYETVAVAKNGSTYHVTLC